MGDHSNIEYGNTESGFTLIELMIVVAILGIISAIAYPSYQGYIEKGHRTDVMSEMQKIAGDIQSRKLSQGKYSNALVTGLGGSYPSQDSALYTITFSPSPLTSNWIITATPVAASRMAGDGTITLNHEGIKCRASKCGLDSEWR